MEFSKQILNWYALHKRDFPWRRTKDPYKIWLSEIILQQTKTSQGLKFYLNFLKSFPTIEKLALANEEQVLKLWQGLGYYSRARNLHLSAKHIHYNLKGIFPNNYDELKKLKGVGPYTAAAISSICFKEIRAAVDGNVYRILARVFEVYTTINSANGIKYFQELANSLISIDAPGDYNQGLMDLGATICTPKKPRCECCPIATKCISLKKRVTSMLPMKIKKIKIRTRYISYFCINYNMHYLMKKRKGNDIWKNLYEFPSIESKNQMKELSEKEQKKINLILGHNNYSLIKSIRWKHKLSHQLLHITIHHITTNKTANTTDYIKVNKKTLFELPVPKPIEKFLKELDNILDDNV